MKVVKKLVCIIIFVIINLVLYTNVVKAATTVTVATDVLNLRKEASTSSDIVATLSEGVKCEFIEESGDWYKVKYKKYTGYVSKEYVKKDEDTSSSKNEESESREEQNTDLENTIQQGSEDTSIVTQVTGKISKKAEVRLLPLIYSSKIDELSKNTDITILTEMNGWAYIQTNVITGWIRSDLISNRKGNAEVIEKKETNTTIEKEEEKNNISDKKEENGTATNNEEETTTYEEKTMYINESSVNVRKEPNTSSKIIMVLGLNQKLTVIGESGDWYKVKTSEGNFFVLKKLLSNKQVTTSRGNSVTQHISVKPDVTTQITTTKPTTTDKATQTTVTTSTNSSDSTKGQAIVNYAKQFLGVPYVYGGDDPTGFDCSGFTMYVYKKFGISMRHGAQAQAKIGKAVNVDKNSATSLKENLQVGDLVFFLDYETMDEIGHCGIYIGDGKFIHASSGSGYCVKINSLLPGEYYNTRYCAARRVL